MYSKNFIDPVRLAIVTASTGRKKHYLCHCFQGHILLFRLVIKV